MGDKKVFRIFHIVGEYFTKKRRQKGDKITMVEYVILEQDGRLNMRLYREYPISLNWAWEQRSSFSDIRELLMAYFSGLHSGKQIKIIRFW